MKSIRFTMTALVSTASIVIVFAFVTKPYSPIDVLYDPITAGKNVTLKGQTNSIIATELKADNDFDGLPDAWTAGSISGHVSGGTKLAGAEYQSTDYSTLQLAANAIFSYYNQSFITDFPPDGVPFEDPDHPGKYITIFRKN